MKFTLVFLAKINSQTDWLDLSLGGRSDLRWSLFFLVSHNLWLWQQMVLLWTPKLPAIHCGRIFGINILIPSFSSPWSCSPWWPDTKEKSGKIFAPDQVINRKKNRSEQQKALVTTDQTWLAPNSGITHWRRCCSAWINMLNKSITFLINESPRTFCPISKTEKITIVSLVAFLFLLSVAASEGLSTIKMSLICVSY